MPGTIRNVRTKTPRPLALRQPSSAGRRHAYRYGSTTPTPPPVAVSIAPPSSRRRALPEELPHEELPPEPVASRSGSLWWLLPIVAVVCTASALGWRHLQHSGWVAKQLAPITRSKPRAAVAAPAPLAAATPSASATPSWQVRHDGHVTVDGGVLLIPKSFVPTEKDYDLLIHFHGDVDIVRESIEYAGVNAALVVINLGERSVPYRDAFKLPGAFERLLGQVDRGLRQRGIATPQLRRLALTSWSAGYGAIEAILEHRQAPHANADPLDAIITFDGIHAGFIDGDPKRINERSILPFVRAAKAAADGELMFNMTHSQIVPDGYASTARTASLLLDAVDRQPANSPMLQMPTQLRLRAARRAAKVDKRMLPLSDTRIGMFRVHSFEGETRDHHAAHLTQMAATELPELVARWSKLPAAAARQDGADASDEQPASEDEPSKPEAKPEPKPKAKPSGAKKPVTAPTAWKPWKPTTAKAPEAPAEQPPASPYAD